MKEQFEVKDGSRTLSFLGRELASISSRRAGKSRWIELTLYQTAAGTYILQGIGAKPTDQLKPQILYHDIIENLSDQHAIILNRSRDASILVPGVALLIYEMAPALFACVAANEAEKVAPNAVINDVQMMGATGRLFMSGTLADMQLARDTITAKLEAIVGR